MNRKTKRNRKEDRHATEAVVLLRMSLEEKRQIQSAALSTATRSRMSVNGWLLAVALEAARQVEADRALEAARQVEADQANAADEGSGK
jgi:hypothetical protein